MEDIKRELEEAYKMLSAIAVSGESVDVMAMAREHLRRAYKLADEACAEEVADNG